VGVTRLLAAFVDVFAQLTRAAVPGVAGTCVGPDSVGTRCLWRASVQSTMSALVNVDTVGAVSSKAVLALASKASDGIVALGVDRARTEVALVDVLADKAPDRAVVTLEAGVTGATVRTHSVAARGVVTATLSARNQSQQALVDVCAHHTVACVARVAHTLIRTVGVVALRVVMAVIRMQGALVNVDTLRAVAGVSRLADARIRALSVATGGAIVAHVDVGGALVDVHAGVARSAVARVAMARVRPP